MKGVAGVSYHRQHALQVRSGGVDDYLHKESKGMAVTGTRFEVLASALLTAW